MRNLFSGMLWKSLSPALCTIHLRPRGDNYLFIWTAIYFIEHHNHIVGVAWDEPILTLQRSIVEKESHV